MGGRVPTGSGPGFRRAGVPAGISTGECSEPNHNHYSAARREAGGEVVARKPDGTPFDHVQDLTQAANGLENVRKALWKEMEKLPDGMTERGLEVLLKKYDETVYHLDRVKGFLHQIKQQP
ncbi:polymorphic toxin type 28 domain-containing protein [Streptomyces cinereoruber]|uniref:polymorphic toxin type 28 domain-containing protein n=1 Tax=Streptomyces cinereoruber TaxID=67260 RepID=UPI003635DDB8